VIPFIQEITRVAHPGRLLDAGCGTGVYLQAMLEAAPAATGDGIDIAPDVVADARERLAAAGLAGRATVRAGDARAWAASNPHRYDLATLLNNVYSFPRDERVDLYRQMRAALTDDGELVMVTMVTPGSPASAHLNFMLISQAGDASLPADGEVERDLLRAGFTSVETTRLVPTEPFVGIRAR
jgi:cyclopropane fatty-acyl-phospholipid synthase-like methyltransferase